MKKIIQFLLACSLALLLLGGCNSTSQAPADVSSETEKLVFAATTLDGTPIDSSIFASYDLTMVNIWASWCGPCVGEMPGLEELRTRLPEGVNLLGICIDGEKDPAAVEAVVLETGIQYPNIVPNAELDENFLSQLQYVPTTVFVDSQGNLVGEFMINAPTSNVADTYLAAIEERLALLSK